MFKLLIVDDEKMTRDGLEQYIPWGEYGISTVMTAKNGLAALELVQREKPDIVLTDVRMPKMDGIQFAMQLREWYPECKIIFLSGYSDKEYLKSAIHLKAVSYIEKPINFEEITQVVKDTVALCEEEIKKKSEIIPFLRQEIAISLVKENADIELLYRKYDDVLFQNSNERNYTAACLLLNWNSGLETDRISMIRRSISSMFCDRSVWTQEILVSGFLENDRIVLIYSDPEDPSLAPGQSGIVPGKALERMSELSQGCFTCSIGVGSRNRGLSHLPASFREAGEAAAKQFYQGIGGIFCWAPSSPARFEMDKTWYPSLREHLKLEDRDAASGLIRTLTEEIRKSEDGNIDYIKNIFFDLLLLVFEAARERGLIETAGKRERLYIWQEIDRFRTLSDLSEYVQSNINSIFNSLDGKDAVKRTALAIMQFIREHYAEQELSIQAIADHSYLSRTYLCSFFKKSTGKTVNEYLTEVRIEKARELLRNGRAKLYEISLDVGFSDVNYFSTLFKRMVGCTPSEYREKEYI